MREYRPRSAPARFFEGAPEIVKAKALIIHGPFKNAICEYEVLFKDMITDCETGHIYGFNGLDFDGNGCRGCHFFLDPHKCRAYRDRNRRNRIAWADLPEATQKAIVDYLQDA